MHTKTIILLLSTIAKFITNIKLDKTVHSSYTLYHLGQNRGHTYVWWWTTFYHHPHISTFHLICMHFSCCFWLMFVSFCVLFSQSAWTWLMFYILIFFLVIKQGKQVKKEMSRLFLACVTIKINITVECSLLVIFFLRFM